MTFDTEMVYKLLDAIYVEYPEGVSTMPDRLSEAVINILLQLDNVSGGSRKDSTN